MYYEINFKAKSIETGLDFQEISNYNNLYEVTDELERLNNLYLDDEIIYMHVLKVKEKKEVKL